MNRRKCLVLIVLQGIGEHQKRHFGRSQESNISINALILNNLYVLDK